jgi:hypothetical protein
MGSLAGRGRYPNVIIELLPPSTEQIDKGEKKQLYEQILRTPEYYLFSTKSLEFIGYRLIGGHYQEMEPDEQGRYFSSETNLYLVVQEGWLRWMTQAGEPTPMEKAEQERQRAEQERQRAEGEAEARRRAEELLERYRQRFGELQE